MPGSTSPVDQNPTAPRPPSSLSDTPDEDLTASFAAVPTGRARKRYAVVGTGHRAGMYIGAITGDQRDVAELVALCDPNPGRMEFYSQEVRDARGSSAAQPLRLYPPDRFEEMIRDNAIDTVIVTTPDCFHYEYVCRAHAAGADVVVEKPLTTSEAGVRAIVESMAATGKGLIMTFNYRYAPRNSALRDVIASGAIGTVTSVHFEWLLDTVHGADYFRRWHRMKQNSGGLLIHKASHHFDLVNWWLHDTPARVFASGGLKFYGAENAAARGLPQRPERGAGHPDDPWSMDLRQDPRLEALYGEPEKYDGYMRDRDVFGPGITIEDNLSLVVDYRSGASMSYSLNAHSPWEGYRVNVNGTEGRAELEVVERGAVATDESGHVILDPSASPEATSIAETRPNGERLRVQQHWKGVVDWPISQGKGGHGGGDALLLADVFRSDLRVVPDALGRAAGYRDGIRAVAVGLAGNQSLATGRPIRTEDLQLGIELGY